MCFSACEWVQGYDGVVVVVGWCAGAGGGGRVVVVVVVVVVGCLVWWVGGGWVVADVWWCLCWVGGASWLGGGWWVGPLCPLTFQVAAWGTSAVGRGIRWVRLGVGPQGLVFGLGGGCGDGDVDGTYCWWQQWLWCAVLRCGSSC